MATKARYHVRSISLPSRPHPLIPEFDEHLCRLRASQASSSSLSISHKLSGLKDLHDCVDDLLLLPLTQQTLAQHRHEKCVDELLDGSLKLLDVCGTPRMKKVKKAMHKALRNLTGMENKCSFSPLNKDPETISLVCMLKEVGTVTLTVLESLLSSIAGAAARSKPGSWSLVSKLIHHKCVACEEAERYLSEFEKVDSSLCTLIDHKTKSVNQMPVDNVQNVLEKLESSIEDLEERIEFLSRHLIKTRVSLLNILNH
ncbi:hypothetical protein AAG906_002884 [Vitis piasezkii]